jgi:uncharacterized protein YlbG (UPF0298 family)
MNIIKKNNIEIQNNLKINYRCKTCEKKYIRKSSLERHEILCDFLTKTKREKNIIFEEDKDIPTYLELVGIVKEISINYLNIKKKMENMEKWIDTKKKKINVIEWLNNNRNPNIIFQRWIEDLPIVLSDIEYLINNNIFQTIHKVWDKINYLYIPIACFSQKTNLFYIYVNENNNNFWRKMQNEDFIKLLQKIQHTFIQILSQWYNINLLEIKNNDGMSITYNKMIIQIMNISLTQDNNYSKIHSNLYNYLKLDLKNLIEYEFEF